MIRGARSKLWCGVERLIARMTGRGRSNQRHTLPREPAHQQYFDSGRAASGSTFWTHFTRNFLLCTEHCFLFQSGVTEFIHEVNEQVQSIHAVVQLFIVDVSSLKVVQDWFQHRELFIDVVDLAQQHCQRVDCFELEQVWSNAS